MGWIDTGHDEPLFTNDVTLLLASILPKRSWTEKIAFGNKYYEVMKRKLNILDIMMYREFGARKARLST